MIRMSMVVDTKVGAGTALTMMAATSDSWLTTAEPLVTMVMTIIVGGATLWYTVERAIKLRKERKEKK